MLPVVSDWKPCDRENNGSSSNDVTSLVSTPGGASLQDMPVLVGLWLIAVGGLTLWYRHETYLPFQWIRKYPDNGLVYVLIQIVFPLLAIAAGIALIASKLAS